MEQQQQELLKQEKERAEKATASEVVDDQSQDSRSSSSSSSSSSLAAGASGKIQVLNEWDNLPLELQQTVENKINEVLEKKTELHRSVGTFHKLLLPTIHGTFSNENDKFTHRSMAMKTGINIDMSSQNVRAWIIRQRVERSISTVFGVQNTMSYNNAIAGLEPNDTPLKHQTALRRLDLTIKDLKMCFDCNDKEQDKVSLIGCSRLISRIFTNSVSFIPNQITACSIQDSKI